MSKYVIDEYLTWGIDNGPSKIEFILAYDSYYEQVITAGFTDPSDLFTFNDNMKVEELILNGVLTNLEDLNNNVGIYWNGDNPLYVKARAIVNGLTGEWIHGHWEPDHRANDGTPIPPKNPLLLNDITNYIRTSNEN